jgi:dTDP-4-dehydrorhamnose 3,5-epimerase/CDP-3, 6-dideoxy-D-glycero-D-glycero-4-hexulose-5-epimerase
MEILKELLPGCFLLQPKRFEDQRGSLVKTYNEGLCKALGVDLDIREEFYSVSHKNVLRGMHFQLPPHEHDKLVYCTRGAVMDVLLDLRKGPDYGKVASAELTGEHAHLVFIPKGIAHGFATLTDDALMLYKTSTVHAPESDCGIRWDSFGFDWGVVAPIISARDQQHRVFADFKSPF